MTLLDELVPGTTYSIDTNNYSDSLSIFDDDSLVAIGITGGSVINEGEAAVFTVTTEETDNTRPYPIVVNLSITESDTFFVTGTHTPTLTIPAGITSVTYEVPTTNDNFAGENSGYITATLGAGDGYQFDAMNAVATVGVRDNAGIRGFEASITDAVPVMEGGEMVFTVSLSKRPSISTRVNYAVHSTSTAVSGEDFTESVFNYVTFRRSARPPFIRSDETEQQIRIPLIHDNYDEADETIVIELISATNNYSIDTFGSQATGTINDHTSDIAMVSIEDSIGLEGHSGNNDIPVALSLNIPSTRDIEVDWATSVATGGTNDATADDFVVATSATPAVISAGQLTGTFNVQSKGDTTANEGDETFTVTISNPTNDAQIANATATVTLKSDEVPVLSIADGADITEANPSDAAVNATFTITSTQLPSTPNNALTVYYNQEGGDFLADSAPSSTSNSIEFADNGSGVITGTLEIPIVNDTNAEVNGEINVVLVEEQSGDGTTYSVNPQSDSAQVAISDDDSMIPVLSIAAPANAITEADNAVAEFIVTSRVDSTAGATSFNPSNPIKIRYSVTDISGDFIDATDEGNQSTEAVSFTNDGNDIFTTKLSIPIGNDNQVQGNGQVKVDLLADDLSPATYTIDTGCRRSDCNCQY